MEMQQIRARLAAAVGGEARLASFYTQRTMRDLDKRAARELDGLAAETALELLARIRRALEKAGLEDFRQGTDEELIARYVGLWAAWQYAGSRVANWMVTGPAKFPVNANNKRIATEDRRFADYRDFYKLAPDREVKRAKRARAEAIGTEGLADQELREIVANLKRRRARQEQMKQVNAAIRKLKPRGEAGEQLALVEMLKPEGVPIGPATAIQLLEPDYAGRRGFQPWQLANNNAEIKRLEIRERDVRAKLERIEAAEAEPAPARTIAGVELVEDAADDRLRLIFPDKPDDATRRLLKGRGFRWSPRAGAWQRQLTANARDAAEAILRQLEAA